MTTANMTPVCHYCGAATGLHPAMIAGRVILYCDDVAACLIRGKEKETRDTD